MRTNCWYTKLFAAALLGACASGCLPVHFALQAGAGEFTLLTEARPIDELLERSDTPPHLRRLLSSVGQVKRFGEEAGLKATSSYQRYEQLDRPAAVFVVSACPELSLEPKLFSFPIAGAVPYLGWFKRRAAQDFARSLESDGLEVDLRGAAAFSTLGWFDDPLLSSMIGPGPEALGALANTVLHESVHATLYVAGQMPFNEGLAEVIADRLSTNYLVRHATFHEQEAFRDEQARRARVEASLHATAEQLDGLYRSPLGAAEKRAEKARLLRALSDELHLRRPLNNALLAEHRAYAAGREGFTRVIEACKDDLHCAFAALRKLDAKSFGKPNQEDLDPLLDALAARIAAGDPGLAAPAK